LADRYSASENNLGFLRLVLATAVLVAHAWPLGFGVPSLGLSATRGQTDLGTVGVFGFFVLSGFLITGSALRFSLPRYLWHRFLRIFPPSGHVSS
jgi:peptidoglycan/LPS O-acetylase OafA/YrhL